MLNNSLAKIASEKFNGNQDSMNGKEQENFGEALQLDMVLKKIHGNMPSSSHDFLKGVERQIFIGAMIQKYSKYEKSLLNEILSSLLMKMVQAEASDIDLGGGGCAEQVWFRVHGRKKPVPELGRFCSGSTDIFIQNMLNERQREYIYRHRNLDFSYEFDLNGSTMRFRADVYFDLDHLALNMRHIPNTIRPFSNLGLHSEAAKLMVLSTNPKGLTLVTGLTGSGKSSTLDSIIDENNKKVDAHIIIIGAPIETIHTPVRCIIRHREVGRDVLTFKDGAVQALRQDPDIIVIGEMRDPDTIVTALEITDSGHKVYSTLHTASAVETIDRIVGEIHSNEQERVRLRLADTLNCVISQKLVPDIKGTRVLAKEVLVMTPSIRAAIRNGNTGEIYQMIFEGKDSGMITLEQDLQRLVNQRKISRETAVQNANNMIRMKELLQ